MEQYKFTNGEILTEEQVIQKYGLDLPDDEGKIDIEAELEIWEDDHYDTEASVKAQKDLYKF